MSHKKSFFIILSITIYNFYIFPHNANGQDNLPLMPNVYISSYNLMQADTLLVVVKNESQKVSGNLGAVKMRFIRSENNKDWVSIIGIPFNKKPKQYPLIIDVPGKPIFKKNITVLKRDFPITQMIITLQLIKKGYTAKKIIKNIENKENKILNKVLNTITKEAYFKKSFMYPLSEISIVGNYGDIRASKNYKIQHLGVDLKAPVNTSVYAINNGKVVFIKSLPDYGNTMIIDHGLGIYSLYLHLSDFKVAKGQMVAQQDLIALSGETGYTTGPHLHFSIKVRGASVDPLKFIQTTQAEW